MSGRHAEIAGAGLAGLMAASQLAQQGWSVRLHEQSSELRMFGAGIWLWENGLRALDSIDALGRAVARAQTIAEWRVADERGRILHTRPMTPDDRLLLPPRADLYEALIERAETLGVDIVTTSVAVDVRPEGVLILADGTEAPADLVVVANGAYSRLRESVRLTASIDYGNEAGIRMLIEREEGDPGEIITEYWNDKWRLLYNPCTDGHDYIFLSAPVDDERAQRSPIDRDLWREKFPILGDVIDRFTEASRWDRLVNVRCRRWSEGHVVVIGDAAHAMPPNLGQAANMAFTNARSLALAVAGADDVPRALEAWERRERPLTEHVQRFSYYYGFVIGRWPQNLLPLRSDLLRLLQHSWWFEEVLNRGARYFPEAPPGGSTDAPIRSAGDRCSTVTPVSANVRVTASEA